MKDNPLKEMAAFANDALVKTEAELLAALTKVDARVLLSSYAMYRMVGMKDEGAKHGRPAPASIELAAYLLMPHFGNTDAFDSARSGFKSV